MDLVVVLILRFLVVLPFAFLLYFSQRHWWASVWRLTARVRHPFWRGVLRAGWAAALALLVLPGLVWFATGSRRPLPESFWFAVSGLWLSSAFFAWVGVKLVAGTEWAWRRLRDLMTKRSARSAVGGGAAPFGRPQRARARQSIAAVLFPDRNLPGRRRALCRSGLRLPARAPALSC